MLARLEALPGAHSATFSAGGLLSGDLMALNVTVPGYTPAPDENMACHSLTVGPRFFETMKMPVLAGRDFGPQDERPASSGNNPGFKGFDPSQNLADAPPLPAVINQAMARYFFGQQNPIGKRFNVRLIAQISGAFSLFALLLASVGLYGVMTYAVTRRTNEIGVRMTLGARGADVVRMVMKETLLLVAIGMAIGLGSALATTRLISSLLFGLTPNDPATIAAAVLLMIVVAALAGYLPARRASRVDPMTALRCE